MKSIFTSFLLFLCASAFAQVSSFDELEFEMDSTASMYKATSKNHVLIKSKRGNSGLTKTAQADAILTSEVTEIVLVYSETEAGAIAEREEANRERWENLLMTYPELFQFSTTYKNVCQCKIGGDAESFKKTQGFYVYINGEVPHVEEPKAAEPAPVASKPAQTEAPATTPAPTKAAETKPTETKSAKSTEKEIAVIAAIPAAQVTQAATAGATTSNAQKPSGANNEPAVKAKEKEKPAEETPVAKAEPVVPVSTEEEAPVEKPVATKTSASKKPAAAKPRKAKDPKACRPACYGFGDEDLIQFFKDGITLSKKQKRKAKNWMANVRLQINVDGTIKKAFVTGTEEAFNVQLTELLNGMNKWNAAVKNGMTVKSEVRFVVKFDKPTKSMKPFDIVTNPKGSPRCPCVSDSEMFD